MGTNNIPCFVGEAGKVEVIYLKTQQYQWERRSPAAVLPPFWEPLPQKSRFKDNIYLGEKGVKCRKA